MSYRNLAFAGMLALIMAVALAHTPVAAQTPAAEAKAQPAAKPAPKAQIAQKVPMTAWGVPDLQGIWTQVEQVPLQRSPALADKEFFTDEEIATRDARRKELLRRDFR